MKMKQKYFDFNLLSSSDKILSVMIDFHSSAGIFIVKQNSNDTKQEKEPKYPLPQFLDYLFYESVKIAFSSFSSQLQQ